MSTRIALLSELYPPSVGGQQTRFYEIARCLAEKGLHVTVIAVKHESELPDVEVIGDLRVIRGPSIPNYMTPRLRGTVRSPIGIVRYALFCRRELTKSHYDYVYFNQWPYAHILLAPQEIRRRSGIDWCEVRNAPLHTAAVRLLSRLVASNCSITSDGARRLTTLGARDVHYLPSGVRASSFSSAHRPRSGYLFLGRLVKNKNLGLLVDAFAAYREMGGEEELTVAGSGPEESTLAALVEARDSETKSAIRIEGAVTEERKRELLERSLAILLPSSREGFPNVIVEAVACGTPTLTVSSPENASASEVDKYGVGVVSNPDAKSLASAMYTLEHSWESFHQQCVKSAPQFDWTVLIDRHLEEMDSRFGGCTK
jgi:glycosyltransferase involved in cell wall biosynthesis